MQIPEVPQVFFIRGVFKETARSIERIPPTPVECTLTPMLKMYEDWNQDWKAQRVVACATCRQSASEHIFIPEGMERMPLGHRYRCHSTVRFCSWYCAAYHIQYFLSNDGRYKLLLNKLYELWTGQHIVEIVASMHPWMLQELGGELTVQEMHRINCFNMARLQSSFTDEV